MVGMFIGLQHSCEMGWGWGVNYFITKKVERECQSTWVIISAENNRARLIWYVHIG
jgi:hypothetical protein